MKIIVKIVYILSSFVFLFYLWLPNPDFPEPTLDSLQSKEPADTETYLRRAYFTNFSRAEVLSNYQEQFKKSPFNDILLPTYRLNYPPEEAQTIIRDQSKSTFLEEIAHPFRESVFVNGFEPKEEKDTIFIEGLNWRQKITVRFVPSNRWVRLIVGLAVVALISVLFNSWSTTIVSLRREVDKKWISR